jgi:hypothetical protein
MKETNKIKLHNDVEVTHGDTIILPIDRIEANMWNPNIMSDVEFNMLSENIEEIGFVAPIVVTPTPDGTYLIVDGYHRLENMKISGEKEIPCIIVSPEIFDEKTIMRQTVRLNKIKGSLDSNKFNTLINQLVNKHEIPFEDLADELGFTDEDEFEALVGKGREQIPKEARKEYDKAVKKVNSIDGLAKLIERLWLKYSGTVPANFFIIDYGNLRHLWVQMPSDHLALTTDKFRSIFALGYKVSSVLQLLLDDLDVVAFIEQYEDRLEKIDEEEQDLDSLLEP